MEYLSEKKHSDANIILDEFGKAEIIENIYFYYQIWYNIKKHSMNDTY